MQKELRARFNAGFSEANYQAYMKELESLQPGALDFRNAETPIFVPKAFKQKMLDACEEILDTITSPNFKQLTDRSIPANLQVPGENERAEMMVFDFGVCENEKGELEPQLIEMQGFPTLYAFQAFHSALTRNYAQVPDNYQSYLNGYTKETYIELLKEIIVGDLDPKQVILLEIFPEQQKTRIDFYCTEQLLGINTVFRTT